MICVIYKGLSPQGLVTDEIALQNLRKRLKHHAQNKTHLISLYPRLKPDTTIQTPQLIQILDMLSFFLDAGYTITHAIHLVAGHTPKCEKVLEKILDHIQGGMAFSKALRPHLKTEHRIINDLIFLGERSDHVSLALKHGHLYLTQQQQKEKNLKNALMYPLILTLMVGFMFVGLFEYLLPALMPLFKNQAHLSWASQSLLWIHQIYHYANWGGPLLFLMCVICLSWRYVCKARPILRDQVLLGIPFLKSWIIAQTISRFSKQMQLVLAFSPNIVEALAIVLSCTNPGLYKNTLESVRTSVAAGDTLSICLQSQKYAPQLFVDLVSSGARSNALEKSFIITGDYYEQFIQEKLETLRIILPLSLLFCLGGLLAFIVYGLLYPLYETSTWIL